MKYGVLQALQVNHAQAAAQAAVALQAQQRQQSAAAAMQIAAVAVGQPPPAAHGGSQPSSGSSGSSSSFRAGSIMTGSTCLLHIQMIIRVLFFPHIPVIDICIFHKILL